MTARTRYLSGMPTVMLTKDAKGRRKRYTWRVTFYDRHTVTVRAYNRAEALTLAQREYPPEPIMHVERVAP